MDWFFLIWVIVILGAIVGYSIYYYMKHMRKKRPMHKDYIWLGEGEHPLKRRFR